MTPLPLVRPPSSLPPTASPPSSQGPARSPLAAPVTAPVAALLALLLIALLLGACQPVRPVADAGTESAPVRQEQVTAPRSAEQWLRQGQPIEARLQRVQDGDSLVIMAPQGQRLTIRLSGIDAPERSQPFANASRRHLQALLEGTPLTVLPVKVDRYGRLVAQVMTNRPGQEPADAGLRQLAAGFAWFYERYQADLPAPDRLRYREAAQSARQARRGLWADAMLDAPWDFRARRRSRQ